MQENNEHINLIFKLLSEEITESERNLLFEWIEENDENKKIFNEYQKVWGMSGEYAHPDIEKIDVEAEWNLFKEESGFDDISIHSSAKKNPFSVLKIVASIAAVFVLVFSAIYFLRSSDEILFAENNVIESKLPDGSEITINKNSKITFKKNYNKEERKIELEGDAFFKIAEYENKPFIIDAETFFVEVLGTEFYVNSNFKERKVIVKKGTVAVYQFKDKHDQVILKAGEEIVFDTQDNVLRKIESFDENYLSWKTKIFNFNDQSLEVIFKELADVYDIEFEFVNPGLKKCRQSVFFENQSIEGILNVLRATFDNLTFMKDSTNEKIYIDGNSCN